MHIAMENVAIKNALITNSIEIKLYGGKDAEKEVLSALPVKWMELVGIVEL